ncbi:protealysin inhibitor emfourin [Agromyces binzhouensis]|uniref:protealysin inhibitor emfourin n=1 Tax=Agromyces binzhouensis TaxID=1817495 RepID=UPI001A928B37|nr:protealysin inhibitor emfourin [Agromyces binzhouensis]
MEVEVSRSGGLAGLRLTWTVEVEDQPDPEEWVLLVERLPWSETPPAPPEPDRYTYRIRCEPHEATLAERQVTGPWRDLVDRVRDVAEPSRGRPSADGRAAPRPTPGPVEPTTPVIDPDASPAG